MALCADQQAGTDAIVPGGVAHRRQHAVHHRGNRHPAFGKALRTDEDLGADHRVGVGTPQIGTGDGVKVTFLHQDATALVIKIEERLQIAELVGRPQSLGRLPARPHAVARRQFEQQFGLDAALQMHVQLGLWDAADECVEFHSDNQFVRCRDRDIRRAESEPDADCQRGRRCDVDRQ